MWTDLLTQNASSSSYWLLVSPTSPPSLLLPFLSSISLTFPSLVSFFSSLLLWPRVSFSFPFLFLSLLACSPNPQKFLPFLPLYSESLVKFPLSSSSLSPLSPFLPSSVFPHPYSLPNLLHPPPAPPFPQSSRPQTFAVLCVKKSHMSSFSFFFFFRLLYFLSFAPVL